MYVELWQMVLLGGVLAFLAGMAWYRTGSGIEDRRRVAIEVAQSLSAMGLRVIPEFLNDYGVGDYSGLVDSLGKMVETLRDPGKRDEEFSRLMAGLIESKLRNPETRASTLALIERLKVSTDVAASVSAATSK